MDRRQFLGGLGAVALTAIAGCTASGEETASDLRLKNNTDHPVEITVELDGNTDLNFVYPLDPNESDLQPSLVTDDEYRMNVTVDFDDTDEDEGLQAKDVWDAATCEYKKIVVGESRVTIEGKCT